MMEAEALWIIAPKKHKIQRENIKPTKKSIHIESMYSGISTGTERIIYSGQVPPSLFDTMKVPYQKGSFKYPVKYGYSLVGRIVGTENKYVHVMHPHQDQTVVSPNDVTILPDGLDPAKAVLLSNMETAVNGVWDSKLSIGDKILVVGFGSVGSLVASILKQMPVEVEIADTCDEKLSTAEKLGFSTSESSDYDVSFNCSGSGEGLQYAIDKTGFEGKIVELSWYGLKEINLALGGSFHLGRKQLISSQVSNLPMDRRGRWDNHRRKKLCIDLLSKTNLPIEKVSFSEIEELYPHVLYNPNVLSTCIEY